MEKQKSVLKHSFYNIDDSIDPHSRIIRQNEDTIIIEDENTIYEIYKQCAIQHGCLPK